MTDLWLASIPLSRLITEAQPFLCGLLEKLLISSSITQSTHKVVTCWFGCCRSLKWCKHLCAFCSSQVAVPQLWCWMTGHNIFRTILWCHSEADLWPFGGQMTLSFYPIRHIMWVLEDKTVFWWGHSELDLWPLVTKKIHPPESKRTSGPRWHAIRVFGGLRWYWRHNSASFTSPSASACTGLTGILMLIRINDWYQLWQRADLCSC